MDGTLGSYRRIAALAEPKLPVKYPRTPGYRPAPEGNPLNAWYWKCSIQGAGSGKLKGKRIALCWLGLGAPLTGIPLCGTNARWPS
ncbi:MAG: hypothetical protein ACREC3_02340 [Methyloceanibacter sp.]